MDNITFKMPPIWDDSFPIINLRRGKKRTQAHKEIIIEVMQALHPQTPTRDALQKFVKIRRKRFIGIFKTLLCAGTLHRMGKGTKGSPYQYCLDHSLIREKPEPWHW